MQINCKMCNSQFGQFGSMNQPRVIPCGHSFCEQCLNQRLMNETQTFQCQICLLRHQSICIKFAPVNRLYYEILTQFEEFLKRKQWEQSYHIQQTESDKEDRTYVDEEFKCLYPFCHRLRYEKQGVKEVFCSAKCMQLNQALYN